MAANAAFEEPVRKGKALSVPVPQFPEQQGNAVHLVKNGLNGGELSPELGARFDQQRHAMGCHKLENMLALPWGGIRKRPGMDFVDWAKVEAEAGVVRLLPFVFSQDQSRLLELSCRKGRTDLRVFDVDGNLLYDREGFLPYDGDVIRELNYCQSVDVIFLAHRKIEPAKIMRYGDADWRFEVIDWLPSIQAPSFAEIKAEGSWPDGEKRRVNYDYVCTAIDAETGEESLPSDVAGVYNTAPLSESWYVACEITPLPGASEYRVYRKSAGVYGFVGRIDQAEIIAGKNGEADREAWRFEDHNVEPDTADTPPRARNPFEKAGEKPSLVFLHQQRLGYAASENHPLTVWLSQSGNYESMAASLPPDADDAIEATLAAPEANSLLWAVSDRSGLLLGTQAGEWLLCPGEGAALTPEDLSFQPQCSYGSMEGLAPVRMSSGIVFAQRGGRVVRNLGYSFQDDRYDGADISILARHIFNDRRIKSWAWQGEPWSVLWIALSDGQLAALTWLKEHEIMAWHRHHTAGKVEQLCSLPAPDGSSRVFMTVLRTDPSGTVRRSLEKFADPSTGPQLDGPWQAPFTARCIPCLPELSANGESSFLMLRKLNAVKALIRDAWPFQARILSQDKEPGPLFSIPARASDKFTQEAVWSAPIGSGWRENTQLELIFDGPRPVTLLALLLAVEYSDMAGGQGG